MMRIRRDTCYIGAEGIEVESPDKELFIEVILFILIGIVYIVFFLTHPDFPQIWLGNGKIKAVLGIFFLLALSPFGAHLIAKALTFLWKRLK